MSLKELLLGDMKIAMREKDVIRKNTIQLARAAILQVEKDKRITLDDDGIMEIISKELKKRKDAVPYYEKSGRTDLVDNLNSEIKILESYLPEPLSEDEVYNIVRQVVEELGAVSMKDMRDVMYGVKEKVNGRADGKLVSDLVRKMLSN